MNEKHPPRWAQGFLHWFVSEELAEEIYGDLLEAYQYRRNLYGRWKADSWFVLDVFRFFRPYSFEKYSRTKQYIPMFNNYVKVSFRNLIKRKVFTSINLIGLSIGITSVMLLGLYIQHETSYDQSVPDSEHIYRLANNYRDQTYTCMFFEEYYDADRSTQLNLVNHLRQYEGVVNACHFVPNKSSIGPNQKYFVQVNGKELIMDHLIYTNTGQAFEEIFPQEFIMGSAENAYSDYQQVIITGSTARRMFGSQWSSMDLLGSALELQDEIFKIAAVVKDVPGNVHFDFDMIVHQERIPSWGAYTYYKTDANIKQGEIVNLLNQDVELVYPGYREDELQRGIIALPLTSIHFTEDLLYEIKPIVNIDYLYIFGVVGIVILLIIWTNYANLAIATYASRQKELGVRKVMGARSGDVTLQILVEAVLLTLICFPITLGLAYLLLPSLNRLMSVSIDQSIIFQPFFLFSFLGLNILTGVISGLYPALAFGKKPMLKLFDHKIGSFKTKSIFQLRRVLLTSQFFMLIGLMSLAIIIMQQMDFVLEKSLGFEREDIVYFDVQGAEKYQRLKSLVDAMPEVEAVGNGIVPGANMYNQLTYKLMNTDEILSDGTHLYTSHGSMEVLGIISAAFELLESGQDSVFIINETAAKKLAAIKGIEMNDLIGETLVMEPEWENETWGNGIHYTIADIIPDFNYFSLKHESQSLLLEVHRNPGWVYNMLIRANTDNWVSTISKIDKAYSSIEKERPFDVTFLNTHLHQLYEKERNAGSLASGLTLICVVLSIMGLVGIVGFITLTKQKEIGVRKVYGASVAEILVAVSKEYLAMLVIATLVAVPSTIYLANKWLESFAYRIDPSFLTVILSGFLTLVIVLSVVILQSYRSATMNPTSALRYE